MITSFNPPKRTLMGPGPSDVHQRVLDAMARPTIGHLDPAFVGMMDELKSLLQYAMQTENAMTIPLSAPGSAGMEMCLANLIQRGDKVIVCKNGVFGDRMSQNVLRMGGTPIVVENEWGEAVSVDKVAAAFTDNPDAKLLAVVHAETSTGAFSDVAALSKLAHKNNALIVVDAVTSLGGIELKVDDWEIDAIYSGTQKCISCPPGLSPVSFSERALKVITSRDQAVQSWFLDVNLMMGYWGKNTKRAYHHTAPTNALYGLHEALVMLQEEGLAQAITRHQVQHNALKAGIETLGLGFLVDEACRLPQLNAVTIPDSIDEAAVRTRLLADYNLEIGAGLGALAGKVWRIGLMGYSARQENVELCLNALETVLSDLGHGVQQGAAVNAARAVLAG